MNNYYKVAILKSPQEPLTYSFKGELEVGTLVVAPMRSKEAKGVVLEKVGKPDFICKELKKEPFYFSKEQIDSANFISKYYFSSTGEAFALMSPFSKEIKKIEEPLELRDEIILSKNQQDALSFIEKNSTSLLFGDTGSGKTEIYIKEIFKSLKDGKSAIFLMPEISLTPQIEKRLKKYFGSTLAIWHSKISKKKKESILEGVYKGSIRLVAGARSALFLPLNNLGLIIVDEEHDDSYKSQSRPKFNAKDMAIFIGSKFNTKIILGSATPSLSSYFKVRSFRLKGKFYNSKSSIFFENSSSLLSPAVEEKIRHRLDKNEQIIFFLPTRGNFKYLICNFCGKTLQCPYCSVSMSLHKNQRALKCHYCGYMEKIPEICPECKNGELINKRAGTAEVALNLQERFKEAKIAKFDKDEISTDAKLKKILNSFNDGEIDILVGTQMISKGHDYHNVSLVVVCDIDYLLYSSDFRSKERALSTLFQIAGRAGRKDDGEVVIKTLNSDFFSQYLGDYELFLKDELEDRKRFEYPPFFRFCVLYFSNKKDEIAKKNKDSALKILSNIETIEIIGQGSAPIEKIANSYRYMIIVKSSKIKELLNAVSMASSFVSSIDVDPLYIN